MKKALEAPMETSADGGGRTRATAFVWESSAQRLPGLCGECHLPIGESDGALRTVGAIHAGFQGTARPPIAGKRA